MFTYSASVSDKKTETGYNEVHEME